MDHLVVPDKLARGGIQRYQRVAEKTLTFPVCAIKIVGRRSDRQKYHSPIDIDTHNRPHIGSRAVNPAVTFPSLVTYLARPRNSVKSPDQLPRPGVEGANGSARPFRRKFLKPRSSYHKIPVNGGRRSHLDPAFRPLVRDAFTKVNGAAVTEALARLAGLGIQSEEASIQGGVKDALVDRLLLAGAGNWRVPLPVSNTATGHGAACTTLVRKRVEYPDFLPRFSIHRDGAARWGREIKHAIHHQGRTFKRLDLHGMTF